MTRPLTEAGAKTASKPSAEDPTIYDDPVDNSKETDSKQEIGVKVIECDYPDGGLRAWLVVVGTMCSLCATFGFINSWGVFQAYYEQDMLKSSTPSQIAWIGSVQYSLVFLPGLITGRLFDLGYFKLPYFIASVLLVIANFLVAQCTQYWQFLLCQGFAVGIACAMIFGPTLGIIGHWFKKKRGFALGLCAVGSSIGGTIFPIITRTLIGRVGFPWTMRVCGFLLMLILGLANIVLDRRLPPKNVSGGLFNPRAFRSAPFSLYCLSVFVMFLGLCTTLTYLDISATSIGISPHFSFYLLSIANASSGFGRYASGLATDRIGAVNVMAPMTLVAAVTTYAWPFARTKVSLIVISVFYGFCSGAYISSYASPLYELGEVEDIGRRTGMALTIAALGALLGPPISGAINRATGGYEGVGYYAGSAILVAVLLMLLARHLVLRQLLGKF